MTRPRPLDSFANIDGEGSYCRMILMLGRPTFVIVCYSMCKMRFHLSVQLWIHNSRQFGCTFELSSQSEALASSHDRMIDNIFLAGYHAPANVTPTSALGHFTNAKNCGIAHSCGMNQFRLAYPDACFGFLPRTSSVDGR